METVAVVIGYGPNRVAIPLLVFDTEENALRYLAAHGVPVGELPEELPQNIQTALFKNSDYYGGCGGCYAVGVKTIPTGTPMVCWDLD